MFFLVVLAFMYILTYANYFLLLSVSERIGVIGNIEVRAWKRNLKTLVNTSLVLPFLRPLLVFEKGLVYLPEPVRTAIIAHELAHITRGSSVRQLLIATIVLVIALFIENATGDIIYALVIAGVGTALLVIHRRIEEFKTDLVAARIIGIENIILGYTILSELEKRYGRNSTLFFLARILGEPTVNERITFLLNRLYSQTKPIYHEVM